MADKTCLITKELLRFVTWLHSWLKRCYSDWNKCIYIPKGSFYFSWLFNSVKVSNSWIRFYYANVLSNLHLTGTHHEARFHNKFDQMLFLIEWEFRSDPRLYEQAKKSSALLEMVSERDFFDHSRAHIRKTKNVWKNRGSTIDRQSLVRQSFWGMSSLTDESKRIRQSSCIDQKHIVSEV